MTVGKIGGATAAAAPAASKTTALNFATYLPTKIAHSKDGTLKMEGELNKSMSANVRYDGASGKLVVSSHMFMKPAEAERPMLKAEIKSLASSLEKYLKGNPKADKAYTTMLGHLKDALGAKPASNNGVTQATTDKLIKLTNQALGKGNLKWNNSLPLGTRMVQVPLFGEKHPDGFKYTAFIPVGALTPTAPQGDPNKATSFYLCRTGGIAGLTQYAGPITIK